MAHEEEFQQMRENHNESKRIDYMSNYKKKVKTVMVNNFANINKVSLVCACLMTHFNNISAISRLEALFVEETGIPQENNSFATSHYNLFLARNQRSCGNIGTE
jgi:hypothetical protein